MFKCITTIHVRYILGPHGTTIPGPTSEWVMFDMTAQAAYNVTSGNKYTFYATALRYYEDNSEMYLGSVRMIAAFSAT